jgi:hypothetical protein
MQTKALGVEKSSSCNRVFAWIGKIACFRIGATVDIVKLFHPNQKMEVLHGGKIADPLQPGNKGNRD